MFQDTITLYCTKSLQSCPTLCDPMDCNLPGSSVHGILQARILEWVAMPLLQLFCVTLLKYDSRVVLYDGASIVGGVNTEDP